MGKKTSHNISINLKRFLYTTFLILTTINWAYAMEITKETASDFQTLYPGVYTEKEKALVEEFIADNKAIEERGPIDVKAIINGTLPEDTPGFARSLKITKAMVRYFNELRDPENPLLNDIDYAKEAGYKDIFAYFGFAAHDDTFMAPYPTKARDTLLVSDLIHHVTNYRPIYPGDTLFWIINSRNFKDLTPETGSKYRSNAMVNNGSVYNQNGEKVLDVSYTVMENIKIYKVGKAQKSSGFSDTWEESSIEVIGERGYYYTDEDWKKIKELWSKEKRQGSTPLYWEDVKIGDQPTWTLEGPIDSFPTVAVPWGMGLGGNRTLKKDILDPDIFKTMVRSEADGIYRPADKEDYILSIPAEAQTGMAFGETGEMDAMLSGATEGGAPEGGARGGASGGGGPGGAPGGDAAGGGPGGGLVMNFTRRDFAVRHISNWMGDKGWLYSMSWGGLYSADMQVSGQPSPAVNPETKKYIDMIPKELLNTAKLLGEGRGDSKFVIVKSVVNKKYVRDGEFFVDLAWWIETIAGDIWCEGIATVKLPSKKAK